MTLSLAAMQWLEARGLDIELADRLGVDSQSGASGEVLVYPSILNGQRVGSKYRPLIHREGTLRFWRDRGTPSTAFNGDVLLDDSLIGEPLVITEGYEDAMCAIQSGFTRTLSVPDGAPERPVENIEQSDKYAWIDQLYEKLKMDRVKTIILAVDGDSAGAALLHDLSVKLGKPRCKFVIYPKAKDPERLGRERLKDLNEVLVEYGTRGVQAVIERAQFIKVNGVYTMGQLPPMPDSAIFDIGFEALGEHLKIRLGDLSAWTGVPSHGKALALDTPIPTPNGWTTMGEIGVGDEVYDERGAICRVTLVTPIQHDRKCYCITFDEGTEVVCDADHLWLTSSEKSRRSARSAALKRGDREGLMKRGSDQRHKRTYPSVVTTEEIAGSLVANGDRNHQVGNCSPVMGYGAVPIPPYSLGAWLGDGHSASASMSCHASDIQILEEMAAEGFPYHHKGVHIQYTVRGLQERLRIFGVLNNKHIPDAYFRAPEAVRVALLQGLMDTDGHANKRAMNVEFCSTNERLALGVFDLAAGLGMKPTILTGRAKLYGRDCGPKFRVFWTPEIPVFRLLRKARDLNLARRISPRVRSRVIVSCEPVISVPVRCIQVDSPSHLYLCTRSYIPTHNTTALNDIICRVVKRYGVRAAWASFEQDPQRDHRRALRSWFCEDYEPKLTRAQLWEADQWIEDHFRFMVPGEDEDPTLEWLLEKMEAAVIQHDCKILVVDPWNEATHERGNESETDYTNRALRTLKKFAKRFQVHIAVVAHPAKMRRNDDGTFPIPGMYDVSGSAAWYNKPDQGVIVHRLDQETTIIKVQKSRFHEILGTPGIVKMHYAKESRRFIEIERNVVELDPKRRKSRP